MVQPRYSNTDYHGSILVEIRREIGDILGEIRLMFIKINVFILILAKTLFRIIQSKTLIDLGFGINRCLETGNIYIESVKAASLADRCGALHVGDIVLGVNGYTISKLDVEKVIAISYKSFISFFKFPVSPSLTIP